VFLTNKIPALFLTILSVAVLSSGVALQAESATTKATSKSQPDKAAKKPTAKKQVAKKPAAKKAKAAKPGAKKVAAKKSAANKPATKEVSGFGSPDRPPAECVAVQNQPTRPAPPFEPDVISEADLAPVFQSAPARNAVRLMAEGQYQKARDLLLANSGKVISDHPLQARFLLARACTKAQDWICAESVLKGLEREIPLVSDHILFMRASAFFGLGRNDAALDLLDQIGSSSVLFRDAIKIKAEILVQMNRDSEAAEMLDKLITSGDADSDTISAFATALLSAGKRDRAVAEMRKAYFKSAWAGRSAFRLFLKGLGISVEPSHRETIDQSWALLNAQDSTKAIKTIEPLLKSKEKSDRCEAMEITARAQTKLRNHPEAFGNFNRLVAECQGQRDMAQILFLGIRSAYRSSNDSIGEDWARKLAAEYPDATFNDDIAVIRARMAITAGRHAQAEDILAESVKRWPNGDMADESRWLLAWSSIKAKKYTEAIRRLEDARASTAATSPYAPRFTYWNARILQRSSRNAEARKVYSECAARWPMTYHAILSLNRLADMDNISPDTVLQNVIDEAAALPGNHELTGRTFLSLGTGTIPSEGPIARALWFSQTGLPDLAAMTLSATPEDQTGAMWLKTLFLNMNGQFTPSHRAAKDILLKAPFWPQSWSAGYYRLAYPQPFAAEVTAAAAESSIDPMLVWAVIREESAFNAGVESWANATGLMQLIMPTAQSMAKIRGIKIDKNALRDPSVNTRLGATYLKKLLEKFKNPIVAIPGYNAGGGAISRWLDSENNVQVDEFVESIQASEARDYARKVFESYAAYTFLYGAGPDRVVKVQFNLAKN
jgi:soluble lytic murein transglycosylase